MQLASAAGGERDPVEAPRPSLPGAHRGDAGRILPYDPIRRMAPSGCLSEPAGRPQAAAAT